MTDDRFLCDEYGQQMELKTTVMHSEDTLQAEILARLNSLEDRIIMLCKQINIIEGMGTIEKQRERIEQTKQEILEQLMRKANAKNRDTTDKL